MIRGDGGRTIRAILDRICNKWTLLIVATLDRGTLRFTDLHQQIPGISQRMLTLTLRNLERDGLVARTVHAQVPPRVEYALTPTGRSLLPPALALAGWAIEHVPRFVRSQPIMLALLVLGVDVAILLGFAALADAVGWL